MQRLASKTSFPPVYFLLQASGAILLLSALACLRGGAAASGLISMFPFMARPAWVWVVLIAGLTLIGQAGRVLIVQARKRRAES